MTRRRSIVALLLAVGFLALPSAAQACHNQDKGKAPFEAQERAMLCLVNHARTTRGLPPLKATLSLIKAADHKSRDILRCNEFSHEACDREFTFWMTRFGYQGCSAGENIAWGSGGLGTPRKIFQAWMKSPGHRENILGPYEETGIGLQTGKLEGYGGAHVWTQEFGSSEC
ncbi:MAG TPA: CAP domain-containing protein [Solirubrobacterales bacterium]|nr:CAP domain-containing protein [Solirubrobacterales bacterium]